MKRLGQFEHAANIFRGALTLVPDFPAAWCELGTAVSEMNDLEGATATYHRTLEIATNNPDALFNLGVVCLKKAQLDNALAWF